MSVATLVGHQWRRHRAALATMAVAAGLFQFMLTRMAPTGSESWVSRAMGSVPPQLLALAGGALTDMLAPAGFLAIGYAHPFFLLLLGAWVVRVSCGALAGEVGRGTMDLLAARPVPRWHFVAAGMLASCGGLVVIALGAWGGTAFGSSLRDLGVAKDLAPVAAGAMLLFTAWAGVGLAVSAGRRDAGSAIAWTAGIIAVSFVLDYLARLWTPIGALRPLSLFRWYETQALVHSGLEWRAPAVLGGVAVAGVAVAVAVFRRRDL